jgi:hypothetical protein
MSKSNVIAILTIKEAIEKLRVILLIFHLGKS